MLRITIALLGFALFGALFAAAYYQPSEVERELPAPKFRLAPGEMAPDFIEPGAEGENITVNITVLTGGPIDVYLMNMENLTLRALNGSIYGFELDENVTYDQTYSRTNITRHYNFTFVADGENRTALLIASRQPHNETGGENATNGTTREERPPVTEVSVRMRYTASETRSLVLGYLMATPSVLLVGYTLYRGLRRHPVGEPPPAGAQDDDSAGPLDGGSS